MMGDWLRIPTKSAGNSGRSRPPVPIEAGQGFRRSRPPRQACSRVGVIIRSVGGRVVKLMTLGGRFSQALAFERESVGVMHEPIEDGVRNGWITEPSRILQSLIGT